MTVVTNMLQKNFLTFSSHIDSLHTVLHNQKLHSCNDTYIINFSYYMFSGNVQQNNTYNYLQRQDKFEKFL